MFHAHRRGILGFSGNQLEKCVIARNASTTQSIGQFESKLLAIQPLMFCHSVDIWGSYGVSWTDCIFGALSQPWSLVLLSLAGRQNLLTVEQQIAFPLDDR